MHFINFLHKFIIILSSKQCENVKCCFLGGENEFNKCSGSSYAFCQTAGEIQHNSRKAVTRSLCQRRLSAEPPPAPCVFFYPPSPSCPAGRLCIRQALCGKQWDWSFVIVIIFISPPTPPLHISCPRPPAFVFVFFFGSPPPPHREVSGLHWLDCHGNLILGNLLLSKKTQQCLWVTFVRYMHVYMVHVGVTSAHRQSENQSLHDRIFWTINGLTPV